MRNSLVFRLMGAFLLVIGIGAIVISALTSRAMREAFFLYTTRSGQVWAQRLALDLSAFYAQNQSWSGVSAFLQPGQEMQMSPGMMGNGMGQGRGNGPGRQATSAGMAAGMGQRLILADENNIVISDTANELAGVRLSASELGKGAAIIVGDTQVGTILVTPSDLSGANAPAQEFLASVNNAIISSTAVAGVIALLLGALLFLQITSPLRRLEKAAAAIAAGDLSQRVVVGSHDEIGKLGLAFNHMAESLASVESQRRQMVADVAHELRTPLAAIQGTLEGMQDGILPLDEEQVSVLYSETLLLNRLVADLKLLSLAEAGQLKLERRETNLPGLVRQVVERAKPQAEKKNVHLVVDLDDNLPPAWADPDRITQVLNNLIGNALRYTPAGGTILASVALASGQSLQCVSITDTGSGIAPADLPYIFDRFYRADKSRTRASGGSGLGLAIVKQLVEAHGGSVSAESPVYTDRNTGGFGTRISFFLPAQPPPGKP